MIDYIYKAIAERLSAECKHIDLYFGQENWAPKQMAGYPAALLDFTRYDTEPLGDATEDGQFEVQIYFVQRTESRSRYGSATLANNMKILRQLVRVHQLLHNFAASFEDPDGVKLGGFNGLIRSATETQAGNDEFVIHRLTYSSYFQDYAGDAYRSHTDGPATLVVTPTIS